MSEERLKEIKDSINYAHRISCDPAISMDFRDKEDLYYEVIRLRETLINKPDTEWTLKTEDGQIMTIIQSERIDMQETLNKTITTLYERINKAIEYIETHSRQEEMWFDNKRGEIHQNFILVCKTDELVKILRGEDK